MMIVLIAGLTLITWVYLIALRGGFWRSSPVLERAIATATASVTVVVPARNEADHIGGSIRSLVAQEYPGALHVVLVDDNSTDRTGEIVAGLESAGRLSIVKGTPLPAGWSGKMWAVHQGLAHEAALNAEFILLTDADVVHAPDHVSALVAKAEHDGLDLVSEMVLLNCVTLVERSLIPAFVFFFQMLYPIAWVNDIRRSIAGAAGGTMLLRRTALEGVGGVSRIRQKLIDDCALAKQIKQSGGSIWLGHSTLARSTRVYANAREVWHMIARTAYEQLGRSVLVLAGCLLGMSLLYFAPVVMTIAAQGPARWIGLAAWLIMAISFQPTLRRYGRSVLWGPALPAIAAFYVCATLDSAARFYKGRGGGWKDRVYSAG
jgi:hopene-associated glycosyltransferase HpnB